MDAKLCQRLAMPCALARTLLHAAATRLGKLLPVFDADIVNSMPSRCNRELAETILDSGDTLLTILGDILDFSKIDHNRMTLESAPVGIVKQASVSCRALYVHIKFCQLAVIPLRMRLPRQSCGRPTDFGVNTSTRCN